MNLYTKTQTKKPWHNNIENALVNNPYEQSFGNIYYIPKTIKRNLIHYTVLQKARIILHYKIYRAQSTDKQNDHAFQRQLIENKI